MMIAWMTYRLFLPLCRDLELPQSQQRRLGAVLLKEETVPFIVPSSESNKQGRKVNPNTSIPYKPPSPERSSRFQMIPAPDPGKISSPTPRLLEAPSPLHLFHLQVPVLLALYP
jgi:hypothetical protein